MIRCVARGRCLRRLAATQAEAPRRDVAARRSTSSAGAAAARGKADAHAESTGCEGRQRRSAPRARVAMRPEPPGNASARPRPPPPTEQANTPPALADEPSVEAAIKRLKRSWSVEEGAMQPRSSRKTHDNGQAFQALPPSPPSPPSPPLPPRAAAREKATPRSPSPSRRLLPIAQRATPAQKQTRGIAHGTHAHPTVIGGVNCGPGPVRGYDACCATNTARRDLAAV